MNEFENRLSFNMWIVDGIIRRTRMVHMDVVHEREPKKKKTPLKVIYHSINVNMIIVIIIITGSYVYLFGFSYIYFVY